MTQAIVKECFELPDMDMIRSPDRPVGPAIFGY